MISYQLNYLKNINYIVELLKYIIDKCFTLGAFPDQPRNAQVTPILKKKRKQTNLSNYRPISSLGYMPKLSETCLKNTLYVFLNK